MRQENKKSLFSLLLIGWRENKKKRNEKCIFFLSYFGWKEKWKKENIIISNAFQYLMQ